MRYYNINTNKFYSEKEYIEIIKQDAIKWQIENGREDWSIDEIMNVFFENEEDFKSTWDSNPLIECIDDDLLISIDQKIDEGKTTSRIIYELFSELVNKFNDDDVYYLPSCYEDETWDYLEPIVKSYINDHNGD